MSSENKLCGTRCDNYPYQSQDLTRGWKYKLFDCLTKMKINNCRRVRPQQEAHGPQMKLKWEDIQAKTRDDFIAVVWCGKT
jgi:hypothetical protein